MSYSKKEISVRFETITPLFTGDAWGENHEVRPSSLIGSLRFWFEIICYFSGVVDKVNLNAASGRFEKEVNYEKFRKVIREEGNSFQSQIKALNQQEIHLPSIVFGTTGWRSLIEINKVTFNENNSKTNLTGKIIPDKNWYWGKGSYQGKLTVEFLVEEAIIEPVFYPLLNFMDNYGYWGGKWNIGYGRLKVLDDNLKDRQELKFQVFNIGKVIRFEETEEKKEDNVILKVKDFSNLKAKDDRKIKILKNQTQNTDFKEVIKKLLQKKSDKRRNEQDKEKRHKMFGSINSPPKKEDLPQGSKILPYITKENGNYVGGFLSIVDLLGLYDSDKKGEQNG